MYVPYKTHNKRPRCWALGHGHNNGSLYVVRCKLDLYHPRLHESGSGDVRWADHFSQLDDEAAWKLQEDQLSRTELERWEADGGQA
jgi:hypothetical protein